MSKKDIDAAEEKLETSAAILFAKQAASRYQGIKCMGTTIHAKVAGENNIQYVLL